MINYLPEFLTVAGLHMLAVMSPGPDFVLITRNSLIYSRKTGIFTSLGIALGILIHITYCLVGIGFIISKSILLFNSLKLLGAGYLIFLGLKSLKSQPKKIETISEQQYDISLATAIKNGFLTNVLNPKATLFFLALFTQVIDPNTPFVVKTAYALEMTLMTFAWFGTVAIILSHHKIKKPFISIQHYVERVMGAALIALGLKVAFSKSK